MKWLKILLGNSYARDFGSFISAFLAFLIFVKHLTSATLKILPLFFFLPLVVVLN